MPIAVFKNYYQILGVAAFSDPETVKAAYRKLARQFHPDLNAGNRASEERFKEINEAYDVLGDPDKRAMYDASLGVLHKPGGGKPAGKPAGKTTGKAPSAKPSDKGKPPEKKPEKAKSDDKGGINDLFESFLKKGFEEKAAREKAAREGESFKDSSRASGAAEPEGGAGQKTKPKRGEDVTVKTGITLSEAEEGVIKTVNVQHNEICRRCSGTGKVAGTVCPGCHGEKILSRLKKIDVRIPAKVKNGSKVRVAREGGRGQGGAENGDLFLQIEIAMDPTLRIEGLDVHGEMPISLTDAALGGEIEVPTLMGPVKMTIPPGTSSGRVFRLRERGVTNGGMRGDHFVTVMLVAPEGLSAREKELYQELARLRPEKPQPKPKPGR